MRLGRRLSAGIAADPPAPPEPQEVEETVEITTAEHREPAEQLVDR